MPAVSATQLDNFEELESIKKFLARPSLVYTGAITSSSPVIKTVSSVVPGIHLNQPPLTVLRLPYDVLNSGGKLEKVNFFEWFKADVVVRVLVNTTPFVACRLFVCLSPSIIGLRYRNAIIHKGRCGITSYPGVELDLQTATSAELRIPWLSQFDGVSLTHDNLILSYVSVYLLTPLSAPDDATSVPIDIYAHFENVELQSPTPVKAVLQIAKESKGPISEISSGISRVCDKLSKIPIIGTVASQVKWASDIVGGVASIFGWSRPIDGSHAKAITLIPGRGFTNFTAEDTSVTLGMSNDNAICEEQVNFMESIDEMQLEHVCQRPALTYSTQYNTSTVVGTNLLIIPVSNFVGDQNIAMGTFAGTTYSIKDYPLCDLMSANFKRFRMDYHFRISLVKTAFHSGRIEVFFIPGKTQYAGDIPVDTTNAWRQIFDITEQSEMEIIVPFMHKSMMMDQSDNENDSRVGTVYIRALTPLVAPATVKQSVDILVWKWATNVAFQCPLSDPYQEMPGPALRVKANLQINLRNDSKPNVFVVFDKTNDVNTNLNACKTVGGEMCLSLRHATRGFRRTRFTDVADIDLNIRSEMGGFLGLCSDIYMYYRGGLNFKFISADNTRIGSYITDNRNTGNNDPNFRTMMEHVTYFPNPVHEISVPFYSQSRREICNRLTIADEELRVRVEGNVGVTYMSAKDDCTFGFLAGAPLYGVRIVSP
jgi:hypothetical protein